MKNQEGLLVVVPVHVGREIPTGTLLAIIKDAGLDKTTFIDLLKS
jgi:predicted RNA binding protein YcfA (HicA-like mRNA interferase family)